MNVTLELYFNLVETVLAITPIFKIVNTCVPSDFQKTIRLSSVIGNGTSCGLLGACSTLFAQSYGSTNPKQVGIYLQTGLYILGLSCLFYWAFTFNTNSVLLLLGQDPEVAAMAEKYMILYAPTLLFRSLFRVLQRYLNAQNIVYPSMMFALISNILQVPLLYLFIHIFKLGISGAALALHIAYLSLAVQHLVYIVATKLYKDTWNGWRREALLDWGTFMTMGAANILMTCLEWWAFELGILLMGILGAVDLAAVGIMFSLWPLFGSLGAGQQEALSVRVGQHLGGQRPVSALTTCRLAYLNGVILGTVAAIALLALRDVLPYIFTSDPKVIDLTTRQIPLLSLFVLVLNMKWICAGVIIGCGKQRIGAFVSFFSYFIVAMPVGISLMFKTSLKSYGYWWGLILGLSVGWIALLMILNRTDWDKETYKAQVRAKTAKDKDKAEVKAERQELLFDGDLSGTTELDDTKQGDGCRKNEAITDSSHHSESGIQSNHYGSLYACGNTIQSTRSAGASSDLRSRDRHRIFIKRGVAVVIMLAVFIFGLICRYVLFIPASINAESLSNRSVTDNVTHYTTQTM